MKSLNLFVSFSIFCVTFGAEIIIGPTKVKRGIFGTVTSTVYTTVQEEHVVLLSCVYLSPKLEKCGNHSKYARFLDSNFIGKKDCSSAVNNNLPTEEKAANNKSSNNAITKKVDELLNVTEDLKGWGEYLGFYRPTVTVTENKIEPTTVIDTGVVVTYHIKDCNPHNVPKNLPLCSSDDIEEFSEIIPTATVEIIKPTYTVANFPIITPEVVTGTVEEQNKELNNNHQATQSIK